MPLSDAAIEKLAGAIALSAAQFAAFYDPLRARYGGLQLMVLNLDPGPVPFFNALREAAQKGWLDRLVETLTEAGALENLSGALAADAGFKAELQGIVTPETGIQDLFEADIASLQARKRICRITVEVPGQGTTSGTGFLIAHQAVLTNWHVVSALIENGRAASGSHARLRIEFDLYGNGPGEVVAAAPDWLIDFSPVHESEDPSGVSLAPQSDFASFADKLDYAVIRLSRAVGRERSTYRLDAQRVVWLRTPGNSVTLYQHPGGHQLASSPGAAHALWPDGIETRLHHSANSLSGSSGGVLVNAERLAIGLHQAQVQLGDQETINCAIPICKIAARVPMAALTSGVDPVLTTRLGSAVFARDDLQEVLLQQAAGDFRILALPDEPLPEILSDLLGTMLDPAETTLASFDARHLSTSSRSFAFDLLTRLFPGGVPSSELPEERDGKTAENAWVKDILMPPLIVKMREGVGTGTFWLVMTGLEDSAILGRPQGFVLEHLLSRIAALPFLRVLLVGKGCVLPGIDPMQLRQHRGQPAREQDYVTYLQRYMVREGLEVTTEELRTAVQSVLLTISENAERQMAGLLPRIARNIMRMKKGL